MLDRVTPFNLSASNVLERNLNNNMRTACLARVLSDDGGSGSE